MNRRRSSNRSSLLLKGAFRYVIFYSSVLCAEFHIYYIDLRGNASFDLFLSVRIVLQVIDLSALTDFFQCGLRNVTNVSPCSFVP